MTEHPEDLPWNDVPADPDTMGFDEPDPAEVVGDEDDPAERDVALPRFPDDVFRRDTLDERLAEEEPDRPSREDEPEGPELLAPETGEDELTAAPAEPDQEDLPASRDEPAEEAAVRIVPDDRV